MNTSSEYAKKAEADLERFKNSAGNFQVDSSTLARAQVYATLAQAAATVELQRISQLTQGGW